MNIIYQSYWSEAKRLQPELATIGRLDKVNKTKYKTKFSKGNITSQEIAKENHENGLLYEFSVFDNDVIDTSPLNYVTINHKNEHVGVNFIDSIGRKYLSYLFSETKPKEELFLSEVWFYEFQYEDADTMKSRTHFVFDQQGTISYRIYDMINKKILDYESKEPMDISLLFEEYPKFGEYASLLREEREIPILKKEIKKYVYKHGTRYYEDEDGNLIEDN